MRSNPTRSAFIIIDMENGFISPESVHCIAGARATVPACGRALEAARRKGRPVFFVKRIYRGDGSDEQFYQRIAETLTLITTGGEQA